MFGCRRLVVFLIAGYLLLGFAGYPAQGEDSDGDNEGSDSDDGGSDSDDGGSDSDNEGSDSDNEGSNRNYTPTYRTGIEKVLQGILKILPSSSSSRSSEDGIGGIIAHLPQPLNTIITGAENVTKKGFGDILNIFEKDFHAIFPGTLWCGAGNISDSQDDVGFFKYTDNCCRGHDNCSSDINAGETKGDLINNGIFTRSACSCDHKFYDCLKEANTTLADKLGDTYFNLLRPQCFTLGYPIESCAEYAPGRIINRKCEKYNFDTSKNKTLIWVDNPDF